MPSESVFSAFFPLLSVGSTPNPHESFTAAGKQKFQNTEPSSASNKRKSVKKKKAEKIIKMIHFPPQMYGMKSGSGFDLPDKFPDPFQCFADAFDAGGIGAAHISVAAIAERIAGNDSHIFPFQQFHCKVSRRHAG